MRCVSMRPCLSFMPSFFRTGVFLNRLGQSYLALVKRLYLEIELLAILLRGPSCDRFVGSLRQQQSWLQIQRVIRAGSKKSPIGKPIHRNTELSFWPCSFLSSYPPSSSSPRSSSASPSPSLLLLPSSSSSGRSPGISHHINEGIL